MEKKIRVYRVELNNTINKLETISIYCCCSVAQSCPTVFDSMDYSMPGFPVFSLSPEVCSNSCPLNQWYHPPILSSIIPFSSCLQSFPISGSFPVSQFIASGGQRIGVSASGSVTPMNTKVWFPLGWTGWIFLQSKGLSRAFSSTTVQKHQFLCTQLYL